jgi:hypothetical protein
MHGCYLPRASQRHRSKAGDVENGNGQSDPDPTIAQASGCKPYSHKLSAAATLMHPSVVSAAGQPVCWRARTQPARQTFHRWAWQRGSSRPAGLKGKPAALRTPAKPGQASRMARTSFGEGIISVLSTCLVIAIPPPVVDTSLLLCFHVYSS